MRTFATLLTAAAACLLVLGAVFGICQGNNSLLASWIGGAGGSGKWNAHFRPSIKSKKTYLHSGGSCVEQSSHLLWIKKDDSTETVFRFAAAESLIMVAI